MKRVSGPELMDAADLSPIIYDEVLTDLARVNRLTLAQRPTLAWLAAVIWSALKFMFMVCS